MKPIKTIFTACFLVLLTANLSAQEYKKPVGQAERITIKGLLGEIKIEGYQGSDLLIRASELEKKPEKAKGLRPVYKNGITDNTGIGLNVAGAGEVIEITGASKQSEDGKYLIRIPADIAISVDAQSPFANDDIRVSNLGNEIEIKTMNGDIFLEEITGPAVINSMNGNIEATFSRVNQDTPSSITSMNGHIDITMPESTPADVRMSSMNGQVYTNFDMAFEKEKDDLKYIGGGKDVPGKINGGGVRITLKSMNDNIYLRKQ